MSQSCAADTLERSQENTFVYYQHDWSSGFTLSNWPVISQIAGWINREQGTGKLLAGCSQRVVTEAVRLLCSGRTPRENEMSTSRFWVWRGCLGWHASATLRGSRGGVQVERQSGGPERGSCPPRSWEETLRFRTTQVVFILVLESSYQIPTLTSASGWHPMQGHYYGGQKVLKLNK